MSINISNLKYVYNAGDPFEVNAIEDININIPDNEIIGIIGHTGCGKSTLIQHMNALLMPTEGKVIVNGIDTSDKKANLRALRKEVGMVFQYPEYQLFEETIAKDAAFGPKNLGLSDEETDKRVREALSMVSLDYDTFAEVSPFALSGGQKRRAAIAGVLAMTPKVLILDEPGAGLDPKGRNEINNIIVDYHKKYNATIILVSHNMEDVARLCTKIFVMNKGRVVLEGTPAEVFSNIDTLEKIGLDIPAAARFALLLRQRGYNIPEGVIYMEQLVDCIMRLKEEGPNA